MFNNPLTTDDTVWHHLTLAACCQLAQLVLKIGFAIAKKVHGIGGGRQAYSTHGVHMAAAFGLCRTALVGTGWTIHKRRNRFRRGETNAS